jgi:glycosyltransferase involved in cell wall biosynthesis
VLFRTLYRSVDPRRVRVAVFASQDWCEEAVRAGLPRRVATTIYFGVTQPGPLQPPRLTSNKLLWVGRLSREKGLHRFIDAVAVLRRTRTVTLTAICSQGPSDYRRAIERSIRDHRLDDVVHLRPAVPRETLPSVYREHDLLLFHSAFREPVALVTLEAFAAGLPVVAPYPVGAGAVLEADHTAVCFSSSSVPDICAAIERALDDAALRSRVRSQAYDLVRARFSLDAMARDYDAALARLVAHSHVNAA